MGGDNDTLDLDDRNNTKDPEIEIRDRKSGRDHTRKLWALVFLVVGFFVSVILDLFLQYTGKEPWVTKIYSSTIVPLLAFILGTEKQNA